MTENTTSADPYTGAGLIEFLDVAIEKGWINVSSAKALRTAVQKIMGVEDGWESLDLRSIDQDNLFTQFQNLRRNDYSDASMRIYKKRFEQALKMHLKRLDNDPNWRTYGPGGERKASSNSTSSSSGKTTRKRVTPAPAEQTEQKDDVDKVGVGGGAPGLLRLPFPLRAEMDVHIQLPRDLTESEAKRLCTFIHSLALPEVRQITDGREDDRQ